MGIDEMNESINTTSDIEEDEREIVKEYLLENPQTIIDIAHEINSWNGSQDWVDAWDLDELASCIKTMELIRAIVYGDVQNIDDMVRYNAYGNLETISDTELEEEAKDNVDSVIDYIYDLYPNHIDIYDKELLELMNIK